MNYGVATFNSMDSFVRTTVTNRLFKRFLDYTKVAIANINQFDFGYLMGLAATTFHMQKAKR